MEAAELGSEGTHPQPLGVAGAGASRTPHLAAHCFQSHWGLLQFPLLIPGLSKDKLRHTKIF